MIYRFDKGRKAYNMSTGKTDIIADLKGAPKDLRDRFIGHIVDDLRHLDDNFDARLLRIADYAYFVAMTLEHDMSEACRPMIDRRGIVSIVRNPEHKQESNGYRGCLRIDPSDDTIKMY